MRKRVAMVVLFAFGMLNVVAPTAQAKSPQDMVWSTVDKFEVKANKAAEKMAQSLDRLQEKKDKNPDKFCQNHEKNQDKALEKVYKAAEKVYTARDKTQQKLMKLEEKGVNFSLISAAIGLLNAIEADFSLNEDSVSNGTMMLFGSCP